MVRQEIVSRAWPSVLGNLIVDPTTNHAALPFYLGRINPELGFDLIASEPAIPADPYLITSRQKPVRHLRVVQS